MNYKLKSSIFYENPENFKQKSMNILMNLLGNSLMDFIKFNSYAIIRFENGDKKHEEFIIEETEKFTRAKINCIIYDLKQNKYNNYATGYDKIFIYYTKLNKTMLYSFFMYNTNTNKTSHVYYIDMLDDALAIRIKNTIIFNGTKRKLYEFYSDKYDIMKKKKNITNPDKYYMHTLKDYNLVKAKYDSIISSEINSINL